MSKTIGLLVMAYGTPYKESDIEPVKNQQMKNYKI